MTLCLCVCVQGPTFGRSERPGLAKAPDYSSKLQLDVAAAAAKVRKRTRGVSFGAPRHKPRTATGSSGRDSTAPSTGTGDGSDQQKQGGGPASPSVLDVRMTVTSNRPRMTGGYIAPPREAKARKTVKAQLVELMAEYRGAWACHV